MFEERFWNLLYLQTSLIITSISHYLNQTMSLTWLLSHLRSLMMRVAGTPSAGSAMSEPCEFTMAATEPVPTTMSTEELARGLLERLAAGGKLSHTTSTSLTTALASAISYRPESNTTAAHDVFHIPELLESILINNNLTTITTCQRVSRQFQATIASSAKLQYKLWLHLKPSKTR